MLRGVSKLLSPELLKILAEMGHGDELVLADGNFPAASTASRLVRADGIGIPQLLDAILRLYPLDPLTATPVQVMRVDPGDTIVPTIWEDYKLIAQRHNEFEVRIGQLARADFYERAKRAYAVVATGESALYANIIARKGVISFIGN